MRKFALFISALLGISLAMGVANAPQALAATKYKTCHDYQGYEGEFWFWQHVHSGYGSDFYTHRLNSTTVRIVFDNAIPVNWTIYATGQSTTWYGGVGTPGPWYLDIPSSQPHYWSIGSKGNGFTAWDGNDWHWSSTAGLGDHCATQKVYIP